MVSANQKPPLATFEKEPSRLTSSTRLNNLEAAAKSASVAPHADLDSVAIEREAKRLLSEPLLLGSTDSEPQPFVFENESSSLMSLFGQPDHVKPAAETAAASLPPDAEDARPQLQKSLPAALPPSRFFDRKPLPAIFSGEPDEVAPAVETVAASPPAHAATAQLTRSLPPTELPALVSTDTESSFPKFEQDLPPSSPSDQPAREGPSGRPVAAADPTVPEVALPQHVSSLLAALRVLNAKPSPPVLEKDPSRPTLASRPDSPGGSMETVAGLTDAESALAQQTTLPEMPVRVSTDASALIFEEERARRPVSDQSTYVAPTAKAVAVAPPANTESVVTRAQQAKSLLAELDLNTAIHLRWVMRDIRSKRTKFSPVSANDLTALMDLGLVEMREGLPRLTALGVLALD
jgi:hypothetical protein